MIAIAAYEVVLALHIMAVVVGFGFFFVLPVVYVVARRDPRSLPLLHRVEYTVERMVVNPALLVILAAGIYLASDGHHWKEFFVQWGFGAVVVIGALVGAVLIPAAKKAEAAAAKDLESYDGGDFTPGEEYAAVIRRLNLWGGIAGALVLLTIFFMAVQP